MDKIFKDLYKPQSNSEDASNQINVPNNNISDGVTVYSRSISTVVQSGVTHHVHTKIVPEVAQLDVICYVYTNIVPKVAQSSVIQSSSRI